MAKLGVFKVRGQSGTVYQFDVYPLDTVWYPVGAVFLLTHRHRGTEGSEHIPLRLGQSANLQSVETASAEWIRHRANCICIFRESNEDSRLAIMADIARAHSFPR